MGSEIVETVVENVLENAVSSIPQGYALLINLVIYTILIAIFAVFIWKFNNFLAKRDILDLNLKQYNRTQHPALEKLVAVILFGIEYIVIMPFLVFFWFVIFALFLILLSDIALGQILLISAALIASIRITTYIGEDISKDLAKILPLTLLAVFLLNPNFFSALNPFDKFGDTSMLFGNTIIYIIFIFVVEIILRGFYLISQLFKNDED